MAPVTTAQQLSNPWEDPGGRGERLWKWQGRVGCCLTPCLPRENFWWLPPRCPWHWAGAGTWACTWGCSSDSWFSWCFFSGCSSSSSVTRWPNPWCSLCALSGSLASNRGFSTCCEKLEKKWHKPIKTLAGLRLDGVLECAFAESCKKMFLKNGLLWTEVLISIHKIIKTNGSYL